MTPISMAEVVTRAAYRLVTDPERAAHAPVLARKRAWEKLMQARREQIETTEPEDAA